MSELFSTLWINRLKLSVQVRKQISKSFLKSFISLGIIMGIQRNPSNLNGPPVEVPFLKMGKDGPI